MSIPKKYLSGLSVEDRKKRIDEIKRGRKTATSDKSAYSSSRFKTDKDKKTKPSKYTQRGKKLLANSNAKTVDAKLAVLSKKTGYSVGTLKQVYNRGLAAWRTGHRPGATQHAWAMARVYSFVTGGKTARTADKDLRKKAMKEAIAFKRGVSLAKSFGGAAKKASGAASFDTIMRGGKSVRVKRDLGGAGGGQFVSFQVAQAQNFAKSVAVNRQVARLRGRPEPQTPQYRAPGRVNAPSAEQVMDQLRDGLQDSPDTKYQSDSRPLWRRTNTLAGGPGFYDYEDDEPFDSDDIVGRGIEKIREEYSFNVEAFLDDGKEFSDLPEEERNAIMARRNLALARINAIQRYTDTSFQKINTEERSVLSGKIPEASELHQEFNDALDALSVEIDTDHSLFRGGGRGWTQEVLGNREINSLDDLRSLIGNTFRTDSFTSTSRASWVAARTFGTTYVLRDMPNGEAFRATVIFRMHRKSGSRGLFVEEASLSGRDEHEVVLPSQEKYVIRGFSIAANHPWLERDTADGFDLKAKYDLPDEYDDLFSYADDVEIEDPKDLADSGGTANIPPVIIIEVEQI